MYNKHFFYFYQYVNSVLVCIYLLYARVSSDWGGAKVFYSVSSLFLVGCLFCFFFSFLKYDFGNFCTHFY